MRIVIGLAAIAAAVVMLLWGRARGGERRAIFENWTALVLYVVVIEFVLVSGVAALITGWH